MVGYKPITLKQSLIWHYIIEHFILDYIYIGIQNKYIITLQWVVPSGMYINSQNLWLVNCEPVNRIRV